MRSPLAAGRPPARTGRRRALAGIACGAFAQGGAVRAAGAARTGGEPLQAWTQSARRTLALTTLEGASASLDAYRGKVMVANLWATWCAPCLDEMPTLERLRYALEGRAAEVVAISVGDTPARVKRFLEQLPVDVPILLDRDRTALEAWQTRVLPSTYILDTAGRPRWRYVGERNWDDPVVLRAIDALLAR